MQIAARTQTFQEIYFRGAQFTVSDICFAHILGVFQLQRILET